MRKILIIPLWVIIGIVRVLFNRKAPRTKLLDLQNLANKYDFIFSVGFIILIIGFFLSLKLVIE